MNLSEISNFAKDVFLSSRQFPYKTGQLHDNFFDDEISSTNSIIVPIMTKKIVYYGKILEVAPAIRYRIKRDTTFMGNRYTYIKHNNIHFRYIDRIIEDDVIPALEQEYGVKRV